MQAVQTAPAPTMLLLREADYARLSEDDEKDPKKRGENVGLQLDECAHFRLSRPDLQHVASFKDNDVSASSYSNEERDDFNRLMDLVRANGVDVILCVEVTRLFRKPLEAEVLIDLVVSKRTSFHTILTTRGGYYDLRTSAGRKAVRDAVNTAAGESDNISDRVRFMKAALARKGEPNGGRRAYGFEIDGKIHVEREKLVWLEARKRVVAGEPVRHILTDFNQRAIPTAEGKQWYKPTLVNMLRRPRYMGKREHHGALYDAVWEGFVTPEEFEELQLALAADDRFTQQRGNARKYLLGGFAFCGSCGSKLGGSMKRDRPGEPNKPRYKCKPYDSRGLKAGCGGVSRLAEPLEDLVTEAVLYRFDSEDFARALADTADDADLLREVLAAHRQAQQKLDGLIAGYYGDNPDKLSRDQFMTAKTAAEAHLDAVAREVERHNSKRVAVALPAGQTLRLAWEANPDLSWRRQILGLVVDRVVVHPGGGKPKYKKWRFDPSRVEITWKV